MNGKRLLRLIAIAVLVLPLGGCWNSRELNELAVVSGIGMDLVPETDEYRVTFQLVNPSSTSTSTSPGSGKPAVVVVSATDKTMFGALRRASKHVTRQLFLLIPSLLYLESPWRGTGLTISSISSSGPMSCGSIQKYWLPAAAMPPLS